MGDTTTLVLAPLVARCRHAGGKMSGGGQPHRQCLDKLESFPGFQVSLSRKSLETVNKYKLAVIGQTARLAPADGKLYALRDVTATVDSIPLIASSIASRKVPPA